MPELAQKRRFVLGHPNRGGQREAAAWDRFCGIAYNIETMGINFPFQRFRDLNELQRSNHTSPYRIMYISTWNIFDKF